MQKLLKKIRNQSKGKMKKLIDEYVEVCLKERKVPNVQGFLRYADSQTLPEEEKPF